MERLIRVADTQTVIRPGYLERLCFPCNYLGSLVRAGELERVGCELYSSTDHPPSENWTLLEVCRKPWFASRPRCACTNLRRRSPSRSGRPSGPEPGRHAWSIPRSALFVSREMPLLLVWRSIVSEGPSSTCIVRRRPLPTVSSSAERLEQNWRSKLLGNALERREATVDDGWAPAKVCRVANVMRPYMEWLS